MSEENYNIDTLLEEYEKDSTNPHILYLLAKSYYSALMYRSAIIYYQKRINLGGDYPNSQVLNSYIQIARCYIKQDENWIEATKYLWTAYEYYSDTIEPLLIFAEHLIQIKKFKQAYHILKIACDTKYKPEPLPILRSLYTFHRYEMMSRVAEHIKEYKECETACEQALKYLYNHQKHLRRIECIQTLFKRYENNRIRMFKNVYQKYSTKSLVVIFKGNGDYGRDEEAVVLFAEELTTRNYKVVVCCDIDERTYHNNVEYIRISDYEHLLREYFVDHLIVVNDIFSVKYYPNVHNVYIWCQGQDFILPIDDEQDSLFKPKLKAIVTKSKWHQFYRQQMVLNNFKYLVKSVPSAIVPERFSNYNKITKTPLRIIYTSCPTKGLQDLLKIFPSLRKAFPNITLEIFSDFENNQLFMDINYFKHIIQSTEGISSHGKVSENQLAIELMKSDYWIHISDDEFDTCDVSIIEAQAAGCICIYKPVGSLIETIGDRGLKIDSNEVQEVISSIQYLEDNQDIKEDMRVDARNWAIKQVYSDRVDIWMKIFMGETGLNVYL